MVACIINWLVLTYCCFLEHWLRKAFEYDHMGMGT